MLKCRGHLYCPTCGMICKLCYPNDNKKISNPGQSYCGTCKYGRHKIQTHTLIKCGLNHDRCKGDLKHKNGPESGCCEIL